MNDRLLALYHLIPAPARSAAATLRGLYLRSWRYSARTDELLQAALDRDTWRRDWWTIWRDARLAYVLDRAATQVPYYRSLWQARRRRGDRASWERLENWPILEKDTVRSIPRAFLADGCDARRMFHESTSGTTGKALDVWWSRSTVETVYAIAHARTRGWHAIPRQARWARLGGQLVTPIGRRRPPFWVWNAAMRQLYMSSHHLAPDLIRHYLDALVRYRIEYLAGYPSSLLALAQGALALGRDDLRMAVVFTNAEPLPSEHRRIIGTAFHCPVRETYGMAEAVAGASECPTGHLHQWPELGHIEVWDEHGPAVPGESGDLLCTSLLNSAMPLIRYRTGDRGRFDGAMTECACGRTLPVIAGIDGRTTDMLITRDGRQVFWLNPVFYGLPVRESQIVQESLDRVRVLVARASGFTSDSAGTIARRLAERLGDVEVRIEYVETVPRTANGKLRAVVCELPAAERQAALSGAAARVECVS
jgi:phenylacetate-CoA ligase